MSKLLLELNTKTKEVKISPIGLFSGYDGRIYKVDETTITRTKEKGLDIPLNVEHCFTQKGCEAVGWFKIDTLTLKEDGVYANLELTKEGVELISSKKYRYLSPEFSVDKDRQVITIDAVALVNVPNFNLEINQKQKEFNMDKKELEALYKEKEQLQKELKLQKEQNQKLVNDLKEQQLNEAVKENKILPAEKELLKEMNLNTLKEYLTKREPLGHTKDLNTNTQNQNSKDSAYAVAANLGWE